MEKFVKLINKMINRSFKKGDYEYDISNKYKKEWLAQGQKVTLNSEYDYIYFSAIATSIRNKHLIEENYLDVKDHLYEFWDNLDYSERKNMVHIDMNRCYNELPSYESYSEGKTFFMNFFDVRMNNVYYQEPLLLDLKQYQKLFKDYKDLIISDIDKSFDYYDGKFVPTEVILKEDNLICLYNKTLFKFYLINGQDITIIPLFDKDVKARIMGKELLYPLADLLAKEKYSEYFNMAHGFGLYSDKFYSKLNRRLARRFF